ncbi:MAG: single-stranded DNA-binding protein [Clostridia bacterium]|nr:single-stranded DNA-binding protein [Clostridia bacterium]
MKVLFLSGRLTADPQIKVVGDEQRPLACFRLANNDGGKERPAEFFDVCAWDKQAKFAGDYLKKGTRILIQGSFHNETYQDKEGNPRTHFSVRADRIEFAGR